MRSHREPATTLPERFFEAETTSYLQKAIMRDEHLCVTIPNWGLISDSDNRVESYARLTERVSVCDRIGSLRLRF
ncbi:hypothetical protein Taro_038429 [Colocasia esculenta]|uniref:Uncharacterized protein n=1 Tax=Colocasia esculenta TaxID=4460 RepID=A0A843WDV6_COLES|nr:hypothetical protein [Colocasia esculenta]